MKMLMKKKLSRARADPFVGRKLPGWFADAGFRVETRFLDRLERALRAGWRQYYVMRHDPRWAALADNPRYRALMAEVKADVDRQRAEVERIDAEEDFPALLDQVRATQQ